MYKTNRILLNKLQKGKFWNCSNLLYRNISNTDVINIDDQVKSFESIPGPKGVCGIGNFYNYLKFGK